MQDTRTKKTTTANLNTQKQSRKCNRKYEKCADEIQQIQERCFDKKVAITTVKKTQQQIDYEMTNYKQNTLTKEQDKK